jgi:hypothetical protein
MARISLLLRCAQLSVFLNGKTGSLPSLKSAIDRMNGRIAETLEIVCGKQRARAAGSEYHKLGIGIRRHVFNLQFQKGSADACRTDRAAFGGFFVLADIDQFDASLLLPSCLLDTDPRQGFP